MNMNFMILSKEEITCSVIVFCGETWIILIKPNMTGSVDKKSLIWFPVENNSCSRYIFNEITSVWSIIKILYCNTLIDGVESHTPYFDVFVWSSCSIPGEVSNTTTQSILLLAGDPYGILIGKTPRFFLVNWYQQKSSCDIIKCIIRTFNFNIERRCISACGLNYDVHVVTCPHKFIRYC